MTDTMWQYTQGEVVLSVPQIMERTAVEGVILHDDQLPTNVAHIPLSKVSYAITRTEYARAYAEFVIGSKSFYVLDSPEIRRALENTMFENLFDTGD